MLPDWENGFMGYNIWITDQYDFYTLPQQYYINTIYKRKKDQMLPVKILESIEEKPGGTLDWKKTILVKLPLAEDLQNQPSSNHFL